MTVAQITGRLREVLAAEKIETEEAALGLIARAAEGSMRDALSILDQVISFAGARITASHVRESIGLIGTELGLELLGNVLKKDAKTGLAIIQNAFNQGVDLKLLLKSLIEMIHAIILMQAGVEKPETHFTDDELQSLRDLVSARALEENELIFQVFHHGLDLLGRAAQPKLIFDLLVIKTSLAEALVNLDQPGSAAPSQSNPRRDPRPGPGMTASQKAELAQMFSKVSETATAATTHPHKDEERPSQVAPVSPELTGLGFSFGLGKKDSEGSSASKATSGVPRGPITWEGLMDVCFKTRPVLAILLESVVEWELPKSAADPFRMGFRERDHAKAEQLQQKAIRDQFAQVTEGYFGFRSVPEPFVSTQMGESLAEKNARLERESREQKMKAILGHQIVQEARSLFGADLTEIKMTETKMMGQEA